MRTSPDDRVPAIALCIGAIPLPSLLSLVLCLVLAIVTDWLVIASAFMMNDAVAFVFLGKKKLPVMSNYSTSTHYSLNSDSSVVLTRRLARVHLSKSSGNNNLAPILSDFTIATQRARASTCSVHSVLLLHAVRLQTPGRCF